MYGTNTNATQKTGEVTTKNNDIVRNPHLKNQIIPLVKISNGFFDTQIVNFLNLPYTMRT